MNIFKYIEKIFGLSKNKEGDNHLGKNLEESYIVYDNGNLNEDVSESLFAQNIEDYSIYEDNIKDGVKTRSTQIDIEEPNYKVINLFYSHLHPSSIKHLHDAVCIKCLGKGSFGEVKLYQCKERDKTCNSTCNKCFVVKEIKLKKWADEQDKNKQLKVLMNEYTIGTLLHHKYIRETLDIDLVDKKIIFEYCPGIDFFELIEKNKENHSKFKNEYIDYFRKIVDAVEYMHDQGVVHLDLKLENIVINEKTKSIKIIDFGGSCVCKLKKINNTNRDIYNTNDIKEDEIIKISGIRGTEAYMAPEEFKIGKYDPFKVDIWALGIIFYEIIYKSLPWRNAERDNKRYNDHYTFFKNTQQLVPYIFKLYPNFYSEDKEYTLFNTLFIKMLNPNPELRSDIKDIKQTLMTT